MTLKVHISDPKTGIKAEVVNGEEENALVVATRPLKTYENKVLAFFNSEYGVDINQNGASGGTPEKVHNGIDDVLWTASDIIGGGKTTFSIAERPHTGTFSIKVDNSPVGDVFQFLRGSDLDVNNYVSLTIWIEVDKDWKDGDDIEIYGWDTGTGLQVGDAVSLQNYFSFNQFDDYHQIKIPLTDMGMLATYTALDALRVRIVSAEGKSPKFFLDDIQFEQTGTPIEFTVAPSQGTWLHIQNMLISVADETDGTLASGTMPNLAYDKILGEATLISGIRWAKVINGEIKSSFVIKKLMDVMELPSASIVNFGDDGTDVWFTMNFQFTEPLILKSRDNDHLSLVINDDLTGLKHLRATIGCKEETR